ncbi:hypothetical protein [Janibacter melonis]|uniref:hypothetical protein n=1 Tax=Janibacter melonis TaxID=262209 RepID=UPI00174D33B7|nr:hypothetical protein [Janibacter melonis]
MADAYQCPTCEQTHRGGCHAHKKPARGGGPCHAIVAPGATACRFHGGAAPQARAKAADRVAEAEARADVARSAARTDTPPAVALLELVQYQAGIVVYWRGRVEDVDEDDLVWGETKREKGVGPEGPIDKGTSEAAPHIAYRLLTEAQRDLERYASAALKAGVDERRVRLAEQEGAAVAGAIRAILGALNLTPEQQQLVPTVVPAQLRLLAGEGVTP